MLFKVEFWPCLLLLAGCLTSVQGEDFPQCANAALDTFVMAIDDCASYIYCNGEDSFRDSCPESTYFDDRTQECAFDDDGVCLRNSVPGLTEEEPDQQITDEQAEETDSNTPAPTPPAEYATISSADSSTTTSSSDVSTPSVDVSTPSADPFPSSPAPKPSSPAPKPSSPTPLRPHCDSSGDGDHPHPQRCEYFYRCLSGYLAIVRCPYKYGWDLATRQCKPMTQAQCFSLSS
ncbi:mucin-2 [Drosophila biarmipes]|uniref:mucin-2 n=1 Tax=Drosophila biarmipes TaxID=125945 RepID=UPI0007E67749|nr:mucin-2 [Drosophila biarmipes]